MPMTLKEMLARIMRLTHDLPPDRFGENDYIEMINTAQKEIAMQSKRYTKADVIFKWTGKVDVSGTAITWESGDKFVTGDRWEGNSITIDGEEYEVSSVTDDENLVLTKTAGTDTDVGYSLTMDDLSVVKLPTDMLRLLSVYWGDKEYRRELTPWLGHMVPAGSVTGVPVRYVISGRDMILNPIPDTAETLSFVYSPIPSKLAVLDDVTDLSDAEDVIIAYVMYQVNLENKDMNGAQVWAGEYQRKVEQWLASYDDIYQTPIMVRSKF